MTKTFNLDESSIKSTSLREIIIDIALSAGDKAAHLGGALSCIDFISVADDFFQLSISPKNLSSLVLSKGHACLSLYSLIAYSGIVPKNQVVNSFENDCSDFLGHPCRNPKIGINFSTGSLGNGLAHSIGLALFRSKNKKNENLPPVVCVVGDGECNEGIVWECLEFINGKNQLKDLIIFIDCNGWQQTQKSIYSNDQYASFLKRIKSYNLDFFSIDGHNHLEIYEALLSPSKYPKIILGKTIKGKGYELFENKNEWHHGVLTKAMVENLIKQL